MNDTFYRRVFQVAGVYNLAFGAWAGLWPLAFFEWMRVPPPTYPSLWSCIGMVVGVYGFLYLYAGKHLDRAFPIIAIGMLGKVLGPGGAVVSVLREEFPPSLFWMILTNDLIWWIPFGSFLWRELRNKQ